MMNQLFISEYNSRVEYGAQFQFVKLKILSIERNALLHTLFAGGGQLQRTVCRRQLCIRMERPGRYSAGSFHLYADLPAAGSPLKLSAGRRYKRAFFCSSERICQLGKLEVAYFLSFTKREMPSNATMTITYAV